MKREGRMAWYLVSGLVAVDARSDDGAFEVGRSKGRKEGRQAGRRKP